MSDAAPSRAEPSEPAPTMPDTPPAAGDPSAPSQPAMAQVPSDHALVPQAGDDRSGGWLVRLLARFGLRAGTSLRDDLHEALADDSIDHGEFSPEERAMLRNILRLREQRVEDIMVPRGQICAVPIDIRLDALLREFQESGHSRLPVHGDTLDDPRGMVLIKDLLLHATRLAGGRSGADNAGGEGDGPVALDLSRVDLSVTLAQIDLVRSVLFVPPSMPATDLMARMQAMRTQMALVIDEYGGTDGLVSLEDVVEEVVGEIEDEHDDEEDVPVIEAREPGVWTVDPGVELARLREEIGEAFDPGERAADVDTVGGLVFALAGHVPVRGEVVTAMPGFEFRVLDADPRRIRRMQIVQKALRDASRARRRRGSEPVQPSAG